MFFRFGDNKPSLSEKRVTLPAVVCDKPVRIIAQIVKDEIHQVQPEQILDIEVKGEWKYDSRMNRLILLNTNDIASAFNNALKKF